MDKLLFGNYSFCIAPTYRRLLKLVVDLYCRYQSVSTKIRHLVACPFIEISDCRKRIIYCTFLVTTMNYHYSHDSMIELLDISQTILFRKLTAGMDRMRSWARRSAARPGVANAPGRDQDPLTATAGLD